MTPEKERVLDDVLAGERPPDDPEFRAFLESDPEFRARWELRRAIVDALDAEGHALRAHAGDERPLGDAPEDAAVERALGTESPRPRPPRAGRWRRGWVVGAALGAALALLAIQRSRSVGPPQAQQGARDAALELVRPAGPAEGFGSFAWRGALPDGGSFSLAVRAEGAERRTPPLLRAKGLREPRWAPAPADARALPDRILWEVRVFDAEGRLVAASEARAWRDAVRSAPGAPEADR